tara:strand:- start:2015 stop:2605 length:591 start_codon:yes stop_codon:yes gene_type:complete
MSAYVHNLTILGGADFNQEYDMLETGGEPIDLTGYNGKSQIRKHKDSGTSVSFNVGFIDRENGKINISIPSWTTAKLKEGRYVYDVLFTSPGGKKEIVLEGRINVRAGISTGCDFSKPTSAQRLCIAVIDEADSGATAQFSTLWAQFRTTYPNRTFYLLQPTNLFGVNANYNQNYFVLRCPHNFLAETTVNVAPLI